MDAFFTSAVFVAAAAVWLVVRYIDNLRAVVEAIKDANIAIRRFARAHAIKGIVQATVEGSVEAYEAAFAPEEIIELELQAKTGEVVPDRTYRYGDRVLFVVNPAETPAQNVSRAIVEYAHIGLTARLRHVDGTLLRAIAMVYAVEALSSRGGYEAGAHSLFEECIGPEQESDDRLGVYISWIDWLSHRGWFLPILVTELAREGKGLFVPSDLRAYRQETVDVAQWLANRAMTSPGSALAPGFVSPGSFLRFGIVTVDDRPIGDYEAVIGSFLDDRHIKTIYITAADQHHARGEQLWRAARENHAVTSDGTHCGTYCLQTDLARRLGVSQRTGSQVLVGRLAMLRGMGSPKDAVHVERRANAASYAPTARSTRAIEHRAGRESQRFAFSGRSRAGSDF